MKVSNIQFFFTFYSLTAAPKKNIIEECNIQEHMHTIQLYIMEIRRPKNNHVMMKASREI